MSQPHADQVVAYIANHAGHHRKRTLQDEYRLLEKYQVAFDEPYVWDRRDCTRLAALQAAMPCARKTPGDARG